nr:hypothetical protein [Vaginisenegalia massiliensis]
MTKCLFGSRPIGYLEDNIGQLNDKKDGGKIKDVFSALKMFLIIKDKSKD